MSRAFALLALSGCLSLPAQAQQQLDAAAWLQKMVVAAQKLNYTGTFTYQSGGNTETSRITHLVGANGEQEKLEVLDGSPREVLRSNDEVKCFLPDDKTVIIERRWQFKGFPALLPSSFGGLGEYYKIHKGDLSRVAGLESQLIILEPRDSLRYGHLLWADTSSGLLLKARMVNERNEPIEQFAFSQVQVGGTIDRDLLKSKYSDQSNAWRVQNAHAEETSPAAGDWILKTPLPGFRKSAGMKRQTGRAGVEAAHFVFSDGLASISVFIEPLADHEAKIESATYSAGAINVYKRTVGNNLITILGEVPPATLKRLGEGIESKKK